MARNITGRWVVNGNLVATTALHVGGLTADPDTDLPLARNGNGEWYIPGTSLAGAFRAWWREVSDTDKVDHLWGRLPGPRQPDETGWASHIMVADCPVDLKGGLVERRDGVGIDRDTASAAEGIKYDRAVLPAGTYLPLSMTVEVTAGQGPVIETMLAEFLESLMGGDILLGAATTRGLGRIKLDPDSVTLLHQDFSTRQGVLAMLAQGGTPHCVQQLDRESFSPAIRQRLVLRIGWRPEGPLMNRSALEGLGVDTLPLTTRDGGQVRLLLTGASVKGCLRSHAERIVRTVLDWPDDAEHTFLKQVQLPLIDALFGSTGDDAAPTASGEPLPGRGALAVADCLSEWSVPSASWAKMLAAEDDRALARVADSDQDLMRHWQPSFHVAVDRWTGGAAESLLYTVLEPHGVAWRPLELNLDLARVPESDTKAALALLLLVLDDLAAGRLHLGYAGNRGMGAVKVSEIKVTGSGAGRLLPGFSWADKGVLDALQDVTRADLAVAWGQWIARTKDRRAA